MEQGLKTRDVWSATDAEIKQIYHDEYWEPYGDQFPRAIDYLYFDMAVNAGPHRAAVLLQRALGVNDDGRIGPVTRQAVKTANVRMLIENYSNEKRKYYRSLGQPRFIRGWLNRTDHVRSVALKMAGA